MLRSKGVMLVFLVFVLGLMVPLIWAQDARKSEQEAMYYRYLDFASLVKGGSITPHWMADGNSFWYAEGAPDKTIIYKVDPKANTKVPFFDTTRLRQALIPLLKHEPPYRGLPFEKFTFVRGEKTVKFTVEGRDFVCQLDTYQITPVPPLSAEEKSRMVPRMVRKAFRATRPDVFEVPSPDRCWFLGVKDYNLWLRSTYDGRKEQLTTDGIRDYEWDVLGARWSPDSFKIAAIKADSRQVLRLPIVHWLKPTEEVEMVPFVKTGKPMPQAELFIVDIISKELIRVDTGDKPDQHIFILGWLSDGSEMIFAQADREWKKLKLLAANPKTGSTRVFLTETSKTFINPRIPISFVGDEKRFIWISERNGWAHLYLYNLEGKLIRQLTKGAFPVVRVVAVDMNTGWIYFTAHGEMRLYDTHLYRISLEGKGFRRLTEATGQHNIQFSPSKRFYLDTHSTVDRPPVVELRRSDGTLVRTISKANIDALKDLKWIPPEEFIVKAADKVTDLYGVLYKPYDFDPNKKYPVIDYIYNGPQTTWVPRTFIDSYLSGSRGILAQAWAQLGFIVFMVDGRGTTERGKEFQDVSYGNFGRYEIPDHVATLKQLAAKRPYIDLSRVGIFGRSWGGYMAIRAMLLAPDVYQVGVSTYPVVDLYDHWAYIEPWMGLPQNNKKGYDYGSSLRLAPKLKGKLLIVHGTSDVNAHFSATMKMVEALIRAGKAYDLIVFPEQEHILTGQSRRYWLEQVRRYFQEHLSPNK